MQLTCEQATAFSFMPISLLLTRANAYNVIIYLEYWQRNAFTIYGC